MWMSTYHRSENAFWLSTIEIFYLNMTTGIFSLLWCHCYDDTQQCVWTIRYVYMDMHIDYDAYVNVSYGALRSNEHRAILSIFNPM